jgi:hypothetical protein
MYLSIRLSIHVSIYPSILPSIHPSIHLFTNLSIYPSVDPSIYPSIYLYIYPSTYLLIYLSVYRLLYSLCEPWPLFQFLNPYIVSRTPLTANQPVAKLLPKHRTTQTQTNRTQTYMPRVRFEPTIPAFDRAKSVHALDRADTVIGQSEEMCNTISVYLPFAS